MVGWPPKVHPCDVFAAAMRAFLAALVLVSAAALVLLPGAAADPSPDGRAHTCMAPADLLCYGGVPNEVCALYVNDPIFHGLCLPIPCIEEDILYCQI
jgi:hypothetical protein